MFSSQLLLDWRELDEEADGGTQHWWLPATPKISKKSKKKITHNNTCSCKVSKNGFLTKSIIGLSNNPKNSYLMFDLHIQEFENIWNQPLQSYLANILLAKIDCWPRKLFLWEKKTPQNGLFFAQKWNRYAILIPNMYMVGIYGQLHDKPGELIISTYILTLPRKELYLKKCPNMLWYADTTGLMWGLRNWSMKQMPGPFFRKKNVSCFTFFALLQYFWTNWHKILAPCLKSSFQATLFSIFFHFDQPSCRPPYCP